MKQSGKIFYIDDYDQQYNVEWSTTNNILNIISTVKNPRIWGESESGYVQNGIVYRKGIITVVRQLISITDNGYQILAEGVDQYSDYIRTNFNCTENPTDPFLYHLNNIISENCELAVESGRRFTDASSDETADSDGAAWADIDVDGSIIVGAYEAFGFINVWD